MIDARSNNRTLKSRRIGSEANRRHNVEHWLLSGSRIDRAVRANFALTRSRTRWRLGAEEILVVEEQNCLSVLPSISKAHRRAGLRILVGEDRRRVRVEGRCAVAGH